MKKSISWPINFKLIFHIQNFMMIIFATEGDSLKCFLKKIDSLEGPKIDKKIVKIFFLLKILLIKKSNKQFYADHFCYWGQITNHSLKRWTAYKAFDKTSKTLYENDLYQKTLFKLKIFYFFTYFEKNQNMIKFLVNGHQLQK